MSTTAGHWVLVNFPLDSRQGSTTFYMYSYMYTYTSNLTVNENTRRNLEVGRYVPTYRKVTRSTHAYPT